MAESKESGQLNQTITSADRIRQLNDVDKVNALQAPSQTIQEAPITYNTPYFQDVANLIHSAGLAVQALTNARSDDSPPATATADMSLDSHKSRFKEATSQYFALLSSIDVRLRRQVYALEEASVLAPDSASRTGEGTAGGGGTGAANPLDISWLNSRKDTVGKDKEAELWAAARGFVEQIGNPTSTEPAKTKEGHQMEID